MVFLIPLAIWFGFLTFIFFVTALILGTLALKGKVKISTHRAFAITTLIIALIHIVFAILLWFFGIVI